MLFLKPQDNLGKYRWRPYVYQNKDINIKFFHPKTDFLSACFQYLGYRKHELYETEQDSTS